MGALVALPQALRELSLGESTVRRLIDEGSLPLLVKFPGSRRVYFKREELDAAIGRMAVAIVSGRKPVAGRKS